MVAIDHPAARHIVVGRKDRPLVSGGGARTGVVPPTAAKTTIRDPCSRIPAPRNSIPVMMPCAILLGSVRIASCLIHVHSSLLNVVLHEQPRVKI